VLDHVGGAIGLGPNDGKRDEIFAARSGVIRELATCPNIYINLAGLGMRMFGFTHHLGVLPPTPGLDPGGRDDREQVPGR
jgi:hypothetical protein